jgi:hypothetical protein
MSQRTHFVFPLFALTALMTVGSVGCGDSAGPPERRAGAIGTEQEPLTGGVSIRCNVVNTFGYVAQVRGSLTPEPPRTASGNFGVQGTLDIRVGMYGDPLTRYAQTAVDGMTDRAGTYSNLTVLNGAPPLESLSLYFTNNVSSSVNASDTTMYQTTCTQPSMPQAADLKPTGPVRIFPLPTSQSVQVDVLNVGTRAMTGNMDVTIGPRTVTGTINSYTAAHQQTLEPGERGWIGFFLPPSTLTRCSAYEVTIDPAHTAQSGSPSPFTDDHTTGNTACLTFTTPITTETLGEGPDPLIDGHTIEEIVNSKVIARESDMNLCSKCHYANGGLSYHPPVAQGQISSFTKDTLIDDPRVPSHARSWAGTAGTPGWAVRFNTHSQMGDPGLKPLYLRDVFQRWLDDGAR